MVNYQKYITVMQLALGVSAINRKRSLPPRKHMWVFPKHDKDEYGPAVYYPKIHGFIGTPENISLLEESEGSVHGKPSLRRIKGRIHRSKSLDGIDLLDSNNTQTHTHMYTGRRKVADWARMPTAADESMFRHTVSDDASATLE